MTKNPGFVAAVLAISMVLAACGGTTGNLNDAAATSTQRATEEPQPTQESFPTIEETQIPQASPTATQAMAEDLALEDYDFVQDGQQLTYVFKVLNPNSDYAVESSRFQVAVYNADGDVVDTDSGYISLVLPSSTIAYSSDIYLDETVKADHIEVQLSPGDPQMTTVKSDVFNTTNLKFVPDDYFPSVTGIVANGLDQSISDLRVTAVIYDDADQIVGGGYTYLDFLPASGQAPVDVSVTLTGKASRVEIYPALSGLSMLEEAPNGDSDLQMTQFGYARDGSEVGVAFIVKNPDQELSIVSSQYQMAAYDADGNVLDTDSGYINSVFPGGETGVYSSLYLPDNSSLDRVEVQIKSGDHKQQPFDVLPLDSSDAKFVPGGFTSKVNGQVTNSLDTQITDLRVDAVLFNDVGEIIGGGFTFVDFIPAQGKTAVSVSVVVEGAPSEVRLYPSITSLTNYE